MIRTTVIPKNTDLHITIPQEYVGKELELLLYSTDEGKQNIENNIVDNTLLELMKNAPVINESEYNILMEKRKHFSQWK